MFCCQLCTESLYVQFTNTSYKISGWLPGSKQPECILIPCARVAARLKHVGMKVAPHCLWPLTERGLTTASQNNTQDGGFNPSTTGPFIHWPVSCRDPIYQHGSTLITAWISNHTPCKVWDEITYPFPNFNGATIEVWEWISNYIPHFKMDVITHSSTLKYHRLLKSTLRGDHGLRTAHSQLISGLLMTWQHKRPENQQLWYWLNFLGLFRFQYQKSRYENWFLRV